MAGIILFAIAGLLAIAGIWTLFKKEDKPQFQDYSVPVGLLDERSTNAIRGGGRKRNT